MQPDFQAFPFRPFQNQVERVEWLNSIDAFGAGFADESRSPVCTSRLPAA
jgi:hypothetical protein